MKILSLTSDSSAAAEELFSKYADTVFRLAFLRTKSSADADDILQDVFLRYMRSGTVFKDETHQKAWFIRTAINCTNSALTSAWRRHTAELPDDLLCKMETEGDVYREVLALPVKYRTVIHLHYYEGYKVSEIADIMGAKESTVKSWLLRAREQLRLHLKEDDL